LLLGSAGTRSTRVNSATTVHSARCASRPDACVDGYSPSPCTAAKEVRIVFHTWSFFGATHRLYVRPVILNFVSGVLSICPPRYLYINLQRPSDEPHLHTINAVDVHHVQAHHSSLPGCLPHGSLCLCLPSIQRYASQKRAQAGKGPARRNTCEA
jgi:hypothetical protein